PLYRSIYVVKDLARFPIQISLLPGLYQSHKRRKVKSQFIAKKPGYKIEMHRQVIIIKIISNPGSKLNIFGNSYRPKENVKLNFFMKSSFCDRSPNENVFYKSPLKKKGT
ncbi:hypothetical protein, partial [Leptospira santarosai]|uniref:hypothetical protein n=2 Tax=Leptospira santarosai TaxID=28183 RepID=UPI0024AF312F